MSSEDDSVTFEEPIWYKKYKPSTSYADQSQYKDDTIQFSPSSSNNGPQTSSSLHQQTPISFNKNFKGLKDFDITKGFRSRMSFLTFEAPTDDDARRLFQCLKQTNKETILLTRISLNGFPRPRYVHAYYGGDKIINQEELKYLVQIKSQLNCVDMKQVVKKRRLWKSMLHYGYSLLLEHNVPEDELDEAREHPIFDQDDDEVEIVSEEEEVEELDPYEIILLKYQQPKKKPKRVNPLEENVRQQKAKVNSLKRQLKVTRDHLRKDTAAMVKWNMLQKEQQRIEEAFKNRRQTL